TCALPIDQFHLAEIAKHLIADSMSPEKLLILITQYDSNVCSKAIIVYHFVPLSKIKISLLLFHMAPLKPNLISSFNPLIRNDLASLIGKIRRTKDHK